MIAESKLRDKSSTTGGWFACLRTVIFRVLVYVMFFSLMRETMGSTNELTGMDLLVCILYRDLQQAEPQVQGSDSADFLLLPY